jgi:hypothetical protein
MDLQTVDVSCRVMTYEWDGADCRGLTAESGRVSITTSVSKRYHYSIVLILLNLIKFRLDKNMLVFIIDNSS